MTQPVKIAASILASDFTRLGEQIREAEVGKTDLFHCDVMDGHFVPNISFGPMIVAAAHRVTALPLDVHLMIEQPEKYLEMTAKAGASMINVHVEVCPDLHHTIEQIKQLKVKAGVAINPHTPFEAIRAILPEVDRVLVMTVNPGFGGQEFMREVMPKLAEISQTAKQQSHFIEIGVDGGVDADTAPLCIQHGANVLIAGSSVFNAKNSIAANLNALKKAAAT